MVRWAKNPWVLGVVASVGAGVPPLVVPAGWPLVWRAVIAAVVAGLAGASGSYFGVVLSRAEESAAAREALAAVLEPLQVPRPELASGGDDPTEAARARAVLEDLLPQWCPTRFWGRRAELDRWWAWCRDEAVSGLLVMDGPGGCGKTRLALRAAAQSAGDGWVTGWLGEGKAAALADAAAAVPGGKVLALVDDADSRTDLGALLEAMAGYRGQARLRVVLIARNGSGLVQALAGRIPERHAALVKAAAVMSLQPLGESADLVRWYGEAVHAFAHARGVTPPPVSAMVAPIRAGQTLIEVLAEAMAAVLRTTPPTAPPGVPTPVDEVARVLMEHEARWWRATAAADRWGLADVTDVLLARVMVALVLFAPAGDQAAVRILRRIPELADASSERVLNLARWAHALYPADTSAGMRVGPDVLTDWFVTTHLTNQPASTGSDTTDATGDTSEFARHLLTGLEEEQAGRVLTVLARAGEHHPPAQRLFEQVLDGDPVRRAHYAVHAALTTTRRHDLDLATAAALARADLDPDTTTRLTALIPDHALPHCALALARHHLRHARTTTHRPDAALALHYIAVALDQVGEYHEGLQAAREAVTLFRELAAENPTHLPGLASALRSLTVALDRVGEYDEELQVAREALTLSRDIAADNPTHRLELANALSNLAATLNEVGEYHEGLHVAQEAVALSRELAADYPAHRPELAAALRRLTAALDQVGEYDEGLQAAREAVTLCRELAAGNATHRPELASALSNLAVALSLVGEYDEELQAEREAIALRRDLAASNPAHRPTLASALHNLAATLYQVGEHDEGLQAAREAVTLCRELAAGNATHRPELASALRILTVALAQVGEYDEGLRVAREAVTLYRDLAADHSTHRLALASALHNLAATLYQIDEYDEGLHVARETVALCRDLAASNPAHRPTLASALHNLAATLDQVGEYREGLRTAREAVTLYRDLAARHPKRFRQVYLHARGNLQRRMAERGDHDDAITFDL
ncbi:tetratricopeptide repeat protein [Actinomadura rayongensis]|uniref:Tetratricopeptide repeat protein n=1 Tax=Actinomadura rayongensis TaxID=1429076 RepID=A0A6I4WGN6_9ACTN|nr:tetratricopeptide repeat protein [Actinomadura rayongensis]MXQ65772.1 tetratricopeptide repeat protein [Actinomadura rayongensis]